MLIGRPRLHYQHQQRRTCDSHAGTAQGLIAQAVNPKPPNPQTTLRYRELRIGFKAARQQEGRVEGLFGFQAWALSPVSPVGTVSVRFLFSQSPQR